MFFLSRLETRYLIHLILWRDTMKEGRRSGQDRRSNDLGYGNERRENNDRRLLVKSPDITIGRLRTIPIFSDLTMEQYHSIIRISSEVTLYKDDILFSSGDTPVTMCILIQGKLNAAFPDNRQESGLSPKDAIGKLEFFTGSKHPVTLLAATNCSIIEIKYDEFMTVLKNDKDMWVHVLSNLVGELSDKLKNDNENIRRLYNTNTMEISDLSL